MRNFKWKLNWSLAGLHTQHGDVLSVLNMGRKIGTCRIEILDTDIVGIFDLNEDVDNRQFVLYLVSSLPDETGARWLNGITLVDYMVGIEKRARQVGNMELLP